MSHKNIHLNLTPAGWKVSGQHGKCYIINDDFDESFVCFVLNSNIIIWKPHLFRFFLHYNLQWLYILSFYTLQLWKSIVLYEIWLLGRPAILKG